jgi:hypothetical protein
MISGGPEDGDRGVCGDVEDAGNGSDDVDRGGDVDAGRDSDLADHVEPCSDPRPSAAAQPVGPEVESTCRRVRRRQLRHRCGNAEGQPTDQWPSNCIDDGSGELETVAIEEDGTREDRNDREGDGEVRESTHLPEQLLGIPEPVQVFHILLDLLFPAEFGPDHRSPREIEGDVRLNAADTR